MTSEDEAQTLFQELMKPVLSEGERTMILLQMGRAAYTVWALETGVKPDWDALPVTKKNSWIKVARISVRIMLSLVGRIWEEEV